MKYLLSPHRMLFPLFLILFQVPARAQYDSLEKLELPGVNIFFSKGHQARASAIGNRCVQALDYGSDAFGLRPEITLLVLSPQHWKTYTNFPVYGMPHYTSKKTLVVASSDNDFWKSFEPPTDALPKEAAEEIRRTYTIDGRLSMQPFFDLLALHELGHAFHIQGGLTMQRKWMGELFCNLFLHSYIARKEPAALPALTLFPKMVIRAGTEGFTYTSLADLEAHYAEIGSKHPKNYGWFQCRLHHAAAMIYDQGGVEALKRLWSVLKAEDRPLTDAELSDLLAKKAHQSIAEVMTGWNLATQK